MRRSMRVFLLVGLAAVVLGGAVAVIAFFVVRPEAPSPSSTMTPATTASEPSRSPTPSPTSSPAKPIPLPTDDVVPDPQPTPVGPATVTIVNWGSDGMNVYASGLVTGEAGTGGVCTLTATSGNGQVFSAQIDAESTPAAVNCGLIEVPVPTGEWTLVLGYRSGTGSAASAPMEVNQP